ncbi:hypothetical protein C3747_258g4 [Trypanosoma cruzi]|uniref:Histone RNA hairpin-binding protein RNA-binding domain-containing protein n=1 Tax=Trypanosoma cruzi TaxID=5693 RepID=A0A2V2VJ12_TRYCR|nr:hypothetical protein C3747_258g4 [Trypanosoma cruzi]
MSNNFCMQTPVRPTLGNEKNVPIENAFSERKMAGKHSSGRRPCQNSLEQERRTAQREKQISYGFVTEGYRNMVKLVESDPLLKSGGILPLSPPDLNKGSKRTWDVSLRKWRRALHMFDNVFIENEDASPTTLESVIENQRLQWVSPLFTQEPKERRVRLSTEKIKEARNSIYVPKRLPVEESLKIILRSEDFYEPVTNVVPPSASSLIRGTDISPLDAGIKIYLTPSGHNQQNSTPEKPEAVFHQESPQHFLFNTATPARADTSPSSMHTCSPSGTSCQFYPGYRTPSWNAPSELHHDPIPVPVVGFSHPQPVMQSVKLFQPPVQQWNSIFAAPACAPQTSNAPVLHSGLNRLRTPATVPRRITVLRSVREERKLGDAAKSQHNLYTNHNEPSYYSTTKINVFSPSVSTEKLVGNTKSIENASENEHSLIDPVSQKLFSEE